VRAGDHGSGAGAFSAGLSENELAKMLITPDVIGFEKPGFPQFWMSSSDGDAFDRYPPPPS
jgi:hypothetical protein